MPFVGTGPNGEDSPCSPGHPPPPQFYWFGFWGGRGVSFLFLFFSLHHVPKVINHDEILLEKLGPAEERRGEERQPSDLSASKNTGQA